MIQIVALTFVALLAGVLAEPPVGYLPPARGSSSSTSNVHGTQIGGSRTFGKTFQPQRSGFSHNTHQGSQATRAGFSAGAHASGASFGSTGGSSGFEISQQYGAPGAHVAGSRTSSFGSPSGSSFGSFGSSNGLTGSSFGSSSSFEASGIGFGDIKQYGAPRTGASGFATNSAFSGSSFGSTSENSFGARDSSKSFGSSFGVSGSGNDFAVSRHYGTPSSVKSGTSFRSPVPVYGVPNAAGFSGSDEQSEPAHYEYTYEVEAGDVSGVIFGHKESREDENAKGSYHVLLPDGRTQIVEYYADEEGFHPKIRYEGVAHVDGANGRAGAAGGLQGPY